MRGRTFSGSFSTVGSAKRLSCRSIRQISSGCLCSSAERPASNGGSNQNRLGRKRSRHLDVGDQELILEHLSCELRAHHPAQRGFGTVAGDHEAGAQPVRTIGRFDRQQHMVVAMFERGHLVAPAQVDGRQLPDAIDQIGLGIELLQVDESRPLVTVFRQQIELIELRLAVKNLADAPHHALVDHALADAEPVPELQ